MALAICSRSALEELDAFCGVSDGFGDVPVWLAAFAFAICSRRAADELDILRLDTGVALAAAFCLLGGGVNAAVPGGDIASPNVPAKEGRAFGVRTTAVLLLDNGRGFGVA